MVRTKWPNVVAQKGRRRKDGTRPVTYYYRVRIKGQKPQFVRMPNDPNSPEFAEKWKSLSAPDAERTVSAFSFDALIADYKTSPRFRELAPRTRHGYAKRLDKIGEWLGSMDASLYPRTEVLRMQRALSETPRTANLTVAVMSILMKHAMDLGWRADNPAASIRKLRTEADRTGGYPPWTEVQIDRFRESADPTALLIMELALGTGQRAGDLVKMRWNDWDGEVIRVLQSKTGAELWVPPTPRLAAILSNAKRETRGLTILSTDKGKPYTYSGIAQRIAKARDKAGVKGVSLHGLRKNATIELAEAGASVAEIKAITGHTTDVMVNHYSRKASQKRLAKRARKR